MSDFKRFLYAADSPKQKSRTINIKNSTHEFFKKTSNFYDVQISTLVNNVLDDWISRNKDEIRQDMIDKM